MKSFNFKISYFLIPFFVFCFLFFAFSVSAAEDVNQKILDLRKQVEELERQMKKLPEFANQPNWELDLRGITIGQAANLGTWVGAGQTRVQACRNAIRAYKKHYRTK